MAALRSGSTQDGWAALSMTASSRVKPCMYAVFIDLIKAFDTDNKETIWTIFERCECSEKVVKMIKMSHDGMIFQVVFTCDIYSPFEISNGVKQDRQHAPTLFNSFLSSLLWLIVQDLMKGVYIKYRLAGTLLAWTQKQGAYTNLSMKLFRSWFSKLY